MFASYFSLFLLPCVSASILLLNPNSFQQRKMDAPVLCDTLPLPSLEGPELLSKLASYLEQADQNIQDELKSDSSPGGTVLMFVYKNAPIWTKGYGLINMSDPTRGPPQPNTGFRIGSITKLLTALMTLMLRDGKQLQSLDEDITDYLPEFSITNPFKTNRGITFRQLMSHMSGLPRDMPCKGLFSEGCNITDSEVYKRLADIELMYPPGQQPVYSNLGFGLLGRVLEKITKARWEESVKKMVFDQLGMSTSGNSFTPDDVHKLAIGYYHSGTEAKFIDIGWDAPAGQTYASAADLAKLMALMFSDDKPFNQQDGQILDGESIREWIAPAYLYLDGTGFSFPWELFKLGNYTLRTKDGAINGYRAEFQMAIESKIGFVFLQSCDDCASHQKIIEIAQSILLQSSEVLSMNQPSPSVPNNPMEYAGFYVGMPNGVQDTVNITVEMIQGHPTILGMEGGQLGLLEWREQDSFQITLRGFPVPCFVRSSGHIGAWLHFQRDSKGTVVSFTSPGIAYGVVWTKQ